VKTVPESFKIRFISLNLDQLQIDIWTTSILVLYQILPIVKELRLVHA